MLTIPDAVRPLIPLIEKDDFTLRQLVVLHTIAANPGRSVRDLAGPLRLNKPAVTRALDALAARQWIVRPVSGRDRRQIEVTVTPAGRAALKAMEPANA